MANLNSNPRDGFGSKLGIIAAAAGSAIGLGNIWRFPYVVGENGGGAFLLVYIGFILAIGIPVMLSEFSIGRRAQLNPFGAFRKLAPGKRWYLIGLMGIVAAFFILSFYSTVAGWTLEYLIISVRDGFSGQSSEDLKVMFETFQQSGYRPVIWQILIMALTGAVVVAGVKNGIEKYTKILMPILVLIIIVLGIRSATLPGGMDGLKFLFVADFSKINTQTILQALGQAFFSLSIGMGTLITYGSYVSKKNNLSNTVFAVSAADTIIAILAGIAIFPAVFAYGITPDEGPGLVFIALPKIFEQMAGGYFFALLFFLLLVVAALTSTISVLEVVVAYFAEELKLSRKKASILATASITVVGIFCTLSQGSWDFLSVGDYTLFDIMDKSSANILLPLGGFFIVIFAGWFLGKKNLRDEISNEGALKVVFFNVYVFIIRFVAPIAIALVFLNGIGLLSFGTEIKA